MELAILPALIAMAIKIGVLWYARMSDASQSFFATLVAVFAVHNLTEIGLFLHFFAGSNAEYILRCYYVATYFVLASMLLYALDVSLLRHGKKVLMSVLSLAGVFSVCTFFFDYIVEGAQPLGYAITAVKGPYYFLFGIFVLTHLIATLGVLIYGYFKCQNPVEKVRCIFTMLSLSPIVLVSAGAVILMKLGVPVNATVVVPIASTLLILITLRSERIHGITDIRQYMPWSLERRLARDLLTLAGKYALEQKNFREAQDEIECLLIKYKLDQHDDNIAAAARSMEAARSTVYHWKNKRINKQ